jgi:hypothetical protein
MTTKFPELAPLYEANYKAYLEWVESFSRGGTMDPKADKIYSVAFYNLMCAIKSHGLEALEEYRTNCAFQQVNILKSAK